MRKNFSEKNVMRFWASICLAVVILISNVGFGFAQSAIDVTRERGQSIEDQYSPRGSIVTELNTGRILWQENMTRKWTPASMSKLMVILLAYDAIDRGEISLYTKVTVTEEYLPIAQNLNLSNNNIQVGCEYTVKDLIELIIVPSSAAATYMLADLIEPDRNAYVGLMNERAKEIGMSNTTYVNPVGVPNEYLGDFMPPGSSLDGDNKTCARDYAALATELVSKYPDIINHTKSATIVIQKGTPYEEEFTGYLHSLPGTKHAYPGMDGLKTGSASHGYNYTGTAKHGDTRLMEVILGVSEWDDKEAEYKRHIVGNALLDKVFEEYEYRLVLEKGKHKIDGKKVYVEEDLYDCVPKGFDPEECVFDRDNKVVYTGVDTDFLPGFERPMVPAHRESIMVKSFIYTMMIGGILLVLWIISNHIRRRRRRKKRRELRELRELKELKELKDEGEL